MDEVRFDRLVRALLTGVSRRGVVLAAATGAVVVSQGGVRAQDATPAPGEEACRETTPEENEQIGSEFIRVAMTEDGLTRIAEFLDPDEVHHWGINGDTYGPDEYVERARVFLTAFPDVRVMVNQVVAGGDLVTVRWTATATHTGPWQGFPATNHSVTWSGINILQIACGKIVESWNSSDHLGLLLQTGLTLPEATPTP